MGLLLLTGSVGMAQSKMNDLTAEFPRTTTTEKLLADQVQKVSDYLVELKTADVKSTKRIQNQMGKCQIEILRLNEKLQEEEVTAAANRIPTVTAVEKYDFDEFENSLTVREFLLENNADNRVWNLHFSSEEAGPADIKVLTPGRQIAFHDHIADFDGRYNAKFIPDHKAGGMWFVHITIGDKATTKKLVFD